ncbi:hypothetical protein [Streptomyces parvulus]
MDFCAPCQFRLSLSTRAAATSPGPNCAVLAGEPSGAVVGADRSPHGSQEGRASYYDQVGALRDMVRNPLLQLLCLVAMEPPLTLGERDLRDRQVSNDLVGRGGGPFSDVHSQRIHDHDVKSPR